MSARVLIIEDNPASLELMRYLLAAHGHSVTVAVDGESGLASARNDAPELVVCDVQLPGIGGPEVVCELKRDPRLRAIPVIAVTALAMAGDRGSLLAAGFDGYIAKPIDPQGFVGQLESFLAEAPRSRPPGAPASEPPAD